ncbi:MAG: hypothetical protein WD649_06510 [Thermoleophilaceae bacterium]
MPSRLLATTFLLLTVGAASLAFPSANAAAAPGVAFGVSDWGSLGPADFSRLGPNRIKVYRRSLDWSAIERHRGYFDFSGTDAIVREAAAHWVRIQPILFSSPRWIDRRSTYPPRGARERRFYARYVRAVVRRYGRRGTFWRANPVPYLPMTHWQVWNEPHLKYFWHRPNARQYLRLAITARRAARSRDRRATILTGSVTHSSFTYVRKLLRYRRARRVFNGVALNLYHRRLATSQQALSAALRFRRFINRRGMKRKPLYITEFGWRSDDSAAGRERQASQVSETVRLLLGRQRALKLRSLIYFSYRDAQPGPGFRASYLTGLRTVDDRPKPAWDVLSRLARLNG